MEANLESWKTFWELTVGLGFGIFAYIYLVVVFKGIPEVLETLGIVKSRRDEKK